MSGTVPFPRLGPANAAVAELREWLRHQRELAQRELATETDMPKLYRLQGRAQFIADMEAHADPHRKGFSQS